MNTTDVARRLKRRLLGLLCELVDTPDAVDVWYQVSDGGSGNIIAITIRVEEGEVGQVIGKQGRTIQALRAIAESIAAKHKQRVALEVDDRPRKGGGHG
jgi:predicted RNA-binding protein YlqC (UPF0109 family)